MREVDTREPWEDIRQPLIATGWEQKKLAYGDMRWAGNDLLVGATRKTLSDLMQSIGDRFAKQLEEMLTEYDICIFILEHSPEVIYIKENDSLIVALRERAVTHSRLAVDNWLHRQLAKGFILQRTNSPGHTVSRLNELYTLYQKPASRSGRSKLWADDRVNALPSGVRGRVGERLFQQYSIRELANMSLAQLRELPDIGQHRAYIMFKHFNRGGNHAS